MFQLDSRIPEPMLLRLVYQELCDQSRHQSQPEKLYNCAMVPPVESQNPWFSRRVSPPAPSSSPLGSAGANCWFDGGHSAARQIGKTFGSRRPGEAVVKGFFGSKPRCWTCQMPWSFGGLACVSIRLEAIAIGKRPKIMDLPNVSIC